MMNAHLFIGGAADGQKIGVNPDLMTVTMQLPDGSVQEYQRKGIATGTGRVDVFTHGIECPLLALLDLYEQKNKIVADIMELANEASRYRALIAPSPTKDAIDAVLDALINADFIKSQQPLQSTPQ